MKHIETISRMELSKRLNGCVCVNELGNHYIDQMEWKNLPKTEGQIKVENSQLEISQWDDLYKDSMENIYLYDSDDDYNAIFTNIETLEVFKEKEMKPDEYNQFHDDLEEYNPEDDDEAYKEILQWWLVDWSDAEYLTDLTDEIVTYVEEIDCYFWGITDTGAWDDVNITINYNS